MKIWIFYRSPTSKEIFIWCEFSSREKGMWTIKSNRCVMSITFKLTDFPQRVSLTTIIL